MIATTALGCGIDIPNIQLVIYAGAPFSLTDFVQGSGRAGRDGRPSSTIILRNTRFKLTADQKINGIEEFLDENTCRRFVLDKYMDGEMSRSHGCRSREVSCDFCQQSIQLQQQIVTPGYDDYVVQMDSEQLPRFNNVNPSQIAQRPTAMKNPYSNKVQILEQQQQHCIIPAPSMLFSSYSSSHSAFTATPPPPPPPPIFDSIAREEERRHNFRQQTNSDVATMDHFKTCLDYFSDATIKKCIVCRVFKILGPCPNVHQHWEIRRGIEKQRKDIGDKVNPTKISFGGTSIPKYCCSTRPGCYVPQQYCSMWESNGDGGYRSLFNQGGKCNNTDILLDVLLLLKNYNVEAADYLKARVGDNWTKLLTTRIICGREKTLSLHHVFVYMVQHYIE